MPEVYEQFTKICATLEYHYRDMQDMEFTIENKKLFMLQTRNGKRTAAARPQDRLRPGGRGHDHREGSRADDRAQEPRQPPPSPV